MSKKHRVPAQTIIDRKTGESKTTYVELNDEEYKTYEKQVLDPFARALCKLIEEDVRSGKFVPESIKKDSED